MLAESGLYVLWKRKCKLPSKRTAWIQVLRLKAPVTERTKANSKLRSEIDKLRSSSSTHSDHLSRSPTISLSGLITNLSIWMALWSTWAKLNAVEIRDALTHVSYYMWFKRAGVLCTRCEQRMSTSNIIRINAWILYGKLFLYTHWLKWIYFNAYGLL